MPGPLLRRGGLLSYLPDLYGTKVLSGQQDDRYGTSGSEESDVLATTGKEPAIAAMDLFDSTAEGLDATSGLCHEFDPAANHWDREKHE